MELRDRLSNIDGGLVSSIHRILGKYRRCDFAQSQRFELGFRAVKKKNIPGAIVNPSSIPLRPLVCAFVDYIKSLENPVFPVILHSD